MKIPRDISGAELINVLCRHFEYTKVHQVGSHVILQTEEPAHHRIAIPNHDPLRIGTLNSVLRAVAIAKRVDKKDILRLL
ncbi:MAG TPA: type II toxin-antitoxin system HicA family toxin [Pyrinomonadaceae bacterium]|nr:type II toxin-antitoxin system HicA family toxin [Pyrinomonadaceae bacterium]